MNTTIKVRKSARQVAIAFASAMMNSSVSVSFPKILDDGYVAFFPSGTAFAREFWSEWESSVEPFGHEAWSKLWKKFARWVKTEEDSVHHGSEVPEGGVAVLDCGEFSIICLQMIIDSGLWEWHWYPVCVVSDPS